MYKSPVDSDSDSNITSSSSEGSDENHYDQTDVSASPTNANNNSDNLLTISWRQLAFSKFSLLIHLATLVYLTYAYAVMPNNLRSATISVLMIIWICMAWFNPLIQIANIYCIYRHWGVTMNKNRWMAHLPENRLPWNYGKLFTWPILIIGVYFCVKFTHASPIDSCDIYSGITHPCVASMIIMILSYIAFVIFGIVLLLFCCCAPCLLCLLYKEINNGRTITLNGKSIGRNDNNNNTQGDTIIKNPMQASMLAFISSYLPISHDAPKDDVCAFCYVESQESDDWRTLRCGHKFHRKCIDPWIIKNNTCPLCRGVVNKVGIVETTIPPE